MKTILVISTRIFWPPDSGHKVVLYNYCKGLAEKLGYKVHILSFLEGGQVPEDAKLLPDFISSVTLAEPITRGEKIGNLIAALGRKDMPFQCCLYQSASNRNLVRDTVEALDPDIVMADMIRLAPYIDGITAHRSAKVIYFEDLLSRRYFRQVGQTGANVLGAYGRQASSLLSDIANGPLKDTVLRTEAIRMERAEDRYVRIADAALFISPIEAEALSRRAGCKNCFSATMGAEVSETVNLDTPKQYDLGFVGNMHTSANQDTLRYLVYEVLPYLPGKTLHVIGVCPDEVVDEYKDITDVSFTGRVDSIVRELGQCSIMLAPFAYGTGIKTKVLEAMGMGVPVVTNPIGLEGIAAERGREVLCADTPKGLAIEAEKLLDDGQLRKSVAEAGQVYVKKFHTWAGSVENLGHCLEFATEKRMGEIQG